MEKEYIFRHPDQMKATAAICCEQDGSAKRVMRVATMWSATKRMKQTTPWDGKIGILFDCHGRERKACVFRMGINGQRCELGRLKYNAAVKWCRDNMG